MLNKKGRIFIFAAAFSVLSSSVGYSVYRGMTKVFLTGYPKYDYAKKNASAKKHQDGQYRMIWTPRWTTNEGLCSFFEYKDKLLEYCKKHMDTDLVFRGSSTGFFGVAEYR